MYKLLIALVPILFFYSCDKKYKFKLETNDKISIQEKFSFTLLEENKYPYDSVNYIFDGKSITQTQNNDISKERLGKHLLIAEVFFEGKSKRIMKTITFLASEEPRVYDYKIINVFPHDTDAYTQGLEYHNGFLYESTGKNGKSSLRKVELKTGKVLQKIEIPTEYFGEGMTILNDKIYHLTWRENIGLIYNLTDFKQIGTFNYEKSKEGWGLTNNKEQLIKTDGTEKIWFLDPVTLKEISFIEAYTDKQSVPELNELEYFNGKLYANVYQKNIILIVNPINGAIEGIADLNSLEQEVRKTQNLVPNDEVLNGIAFDAQNNRIFVTGKHWGKLFEIQLIPRE